MRRFLLPRPIAFLPRLAVAVLAVAGLAGCVSARTEDGALVTRFSRFADEAEVDALAKRVDGTDAALAKAHEDRTNALATLWEKVTAADTQLRTDLTAADEQIRKDLVAQQEASAAAFEQAIAAGKSQADAVRDAAAAGVKQATELAATAKAVAGDAATRASAASEDVKARAEAFAAEIGKRLEAEAKARQEQYTDAIDETRGSKWNWYEIALYALTGGAVAGPVVTRVARGAPLRSGAGTLKAADDLAKAQARAAVIALDAEELARAKARIAAAAAPAAPATGAAS